MSFIPFTFGAPLMLIALALLPVIWWLNRLTPPKPTQEPFPPFAILATILKKEDTPAKSPWWLTALRVILATIVILALADPILNPRKERLISNGPLLLLLDDSWASATNWQHYLNTANSFLDEAEDKDIPVIIVPSTYSPNNLALGTADNARQILASIEPRPMKPFQSDIVTPIVTALADQAIGTLAIISSNIDTENTSEILDALVKLNPDNIEIVTANNASTAGITAAINNSTSISVNVSRTVDSEAQSFQINGYDLQSRPIINGTVNFTAGERSTSANVEAPFELLNDVIHLSIKDNQHAAGSFLLDDKFRRRKLALFAGESQDIINPLLTSTHYITRASLPFADFIDVSQVNLSVDITQLLEQNPSAIILSDIGTLEVGVSEELVKWVKAGGTLIRFAGSRLASSSADNITDDPLMPVNLRSGSRQLGGSLTWSEPKRLAVFPANSPFFGIKSSNEIIVKRQVLAEPSLDLVDNTWASLEDGTPLVTAKTSGAGRIVLFHITAETNWSNLPLSGEFAEMLKRIISLTRTGNKGNSNSNNIAFLPPYKSLNAKGSLTTADGNTNPLEIRANGEVVLTSQTLPGLYGTEEGWQAINLLKDDDQLNPIALPESEIDIQRSNLETGSVTELKPWFLLMALALLMLDALIVLIMSGMLSRFKRFKSQQLGTKVSAIFAVVFLAIMTNPSPSQAQDTQLGDAEIIQRLESTSLAYVITKNRQVDRISELGLNGLNFYLRTRTALEPSPAVGLDLENDDLSFYPIIYWPMTDDALLPSKKAMGNVENFMKQGGTVLFDTRDALSGFGSGFGNAGNVSQRTLKLRSILANIDIPPLEPVPEDHVLTKSFYLLDSFPGRYASGPLWTETLSPDRDSQTRIVNGGDGVSPIMITSNDFAGAWAMDESRRPILPMIPQSERQRTLAYRTGVNIVMYMLTGNYKADQVHLPALLERLGQ